MKNLLFTLFLVLVVSLFVGSSEAGCGSCAKDSVEAVGGGCGQEGAAAACGSGGGCAKAAAAAADGKCDCGKEAGDCACAEGACDCGKIAADCTCPKTGGKGSCGCGSPEACDCKKS